LSKVTIIDVARLAGVSKGTVDRVLHNRGEVSAKSAEKVREAIAALDFHPNVHASFLSSRKPRVIACLTPFYKKGEFWEKVHDGLVEGGLAAAEDNVCLKFFFYNQYDLENFNLAAEELLKSRPDGVILPTLFKDATFEFVGRLSAAGIPYVFVDTKVEDDSGYLAFIGMPRRDSGALCAALLTEQVKEVKDILIVRIKRDSEGRSDPTARRREGFLNYIKEHFPEAEIFNVFIDPSDDASIRSEMTRFFSEHAQTRFVVMFNSRLHLLRQILADFPLEERRVIGFDDLPENLAMLKSGLASIIIAQHIEVQCKKAVEILSNYILTQKLPSLPDNYTHIDILTKYNIENY